MLFLVSTYSEYLKCHYLSWRPDEWPFVFKSLILCNYLLPKDSSSDMVVMQVELRIFVYLINSDTLLTTVHLFLNTVFVLDWKSARLKCIMPLCFLLQSHFVVSAQQILSFTRQSTLANVMLTNIMQVYAWNALAHLGLLLPWEPAQASVLEDEGHMEQTGVVPVISAMVISHQLISSRTADTLLIQHYCGKHNQNDFLDSTLNTREWEHHALINSVSFICRVVADLICLGCIEFDKSYHFPFLKGSAGISYF